LAFDSKMKSMAARAGPKKVQIKVKAKKELC
jgi:hypothetical protein